MSYQIDAQLNKQNAQLRIVEAETGRLRLAWDCPLHNGPMSSQARHELQRLFRELMLLSTLDTLHGRHAGAALLKPKNIP
ncbi:MAG: hypothetical protein ACPHER_02965 [Nevskiales bacterium]